VSYALSLRIRMGFLRQTNFMVFLCGLLHRNGTGDVA
jgi:hypothetical protein